MATGQRSPRWVIILANDPFPQVFYDEGAARAFVQKNKAEVTQIIHESLAAQFDKYVVWNQTDIDPKTW